MRIFYRGYVIDEEIRSISYSVYGPRPERPELAAKGTSREAMQWVDTNVRRENILGAIGTLQTPIYQVA